MKLFGLFAVSVNAMGSSNPDCPEGWTSIWNQETHGYHPWCYQFSVGPSGRPGGSYAQAKERCAELGGQLPLPRNDRENEDFAAAYNHIPTNWLGIEWDGSKWVDNDGEEVTYFAWAENNPQMIPSVENNVFNGAHQTESSSKKEWKNLPAGAGSEIICVISTESEPEPPTVEPPKTKKPVDTRPGKLRDDILEVLEDSGFADTRLYNLVNKRVSSNKGKMITQMFMLRDEKGCTFPEHWDWEEYLDSEFNPDRYNQENPCKAINQLFLGLDRWMQIFTRDCTKPAENALKFHGRRNTQLTRIRNRIFVRMECQQFITKYGL